MQHFDLFLSIAEIAGVFVGFGALISLLRPGREAGHATLRGVIANGLVAMVAAVIPVALSQYGLSDEALWAWASGSFLLLCWVALFAAIHNPDIRETTASDARANPVITIVFWGLLEVPLQLPLVLILLGVAPTQPRALYFTALVLCLVQAAFLLGRAVFARTS